MSAITVDKLIETFPHLSVPHVSGRSLTEPIDEVYLKLNADAAFVYSNRGNEKVGVLCLTSQPDVCYTLHTIEFVPKINPGSNLDMPETKLETK